MLRITNDGRKLALDMRLINPLAADDPNGKVAVCARNVYRIWEQTKEKRSTQLVFCDLSTPTKDGSFNVYDDLKKKLMEQGIPEDEIAFIHDADSEAKKKELFAKVRTGQIRVLMGSTQKMGAVQTSKISSSPCTTWTAPGVLPTFSSGWAALCARATITRRWRSSAM